MRLSEFSPAARPFGSTGSASVRLQLVEMSSFVTKAGEAMASRYLEEGSPGIVRGNCLYKLAEDIQRITCGQPHKIPFSMLIKVCETLGPLYKDNRMNSKIISKCCATCTVLEHFFRHKTPVTDVRYKDGLWMFDEYEMLRPMKGKLNKVKLDELRGLHDQMLQVSEALDVWGGLAAGHDAECVFLAILWPVHVLIQDLQPVLREFIYEHTAATQ